MSAYTIACLGKGGTGKTLVSTLIGRIARDAGMRVLLVDADPVMGLSFNCGLAGIRTVADAREEIVRQVKALTSDSTEDEAREIVSFLLSQTLVERDGLAFIAMGQSRSLGCYCSVNMLLRRMIASILERFDMVVIDAEAGIEQVNRQVIERVDQALLMCDGSRRAVETCLLVRDTAGKIPMMSKCRMGVVFNRVPAIPEAHRVTLENSGLPVIGFLPQDDAVSEADADLGALKGLPAGSTTYVGVSRILREIGVPAPASET
jgi:CO dehydrogenase maturation factor